MKVRGCEWHCFIAAEVWGMFPSPAQAADSNQRSASSGLTHILYIWMVWRKRTFCPEWECIVNLVSTPFYHTVALISMSLNLSHVGTHWWHCSHFTYNIPQGFLCEMSAKLFDGFLYNFVKIIKVSTGWIIQTLVIPWFRIFNNPVQNIYWVNWYKILLRP